MARNNSGSKSGNKPRKGLDLADIGLVYSTESGRLCPACEQPLDQCSCKQHEAEPEASDGIVRVRREKKGRGGKVVTVISGLGMKTNQLKGYLKTLQKQCGSGGTVKEGCIELQGDRLEHAMRLLEKDGYQVRHSGG